MAYENKNMEGELQWKNWAKYLNDTADAIEELKQLGAVSYFDAKTLNAYYSKLEMFFISRYPYIENRDDIRKRLDKIADTIFSERYVNDVNKNKNSAKLYRTQYYVMRNLNNILSDIIVSLSKNEILPKIVKKDKNAPGITKMDN